MTLTGMTEISEGGYRRYKEHEKHKICRDFLRNLCKRGALCKYYHPIGDDGKEIYVFCHDFQNGNCIRANCKFIHCSAADEQHYIQTGEAFPHIIEAHKKIMESIREMLPICKDYGRGRCVKTSCKFRHSPEIRNNVPDDGNETESEYSRSEFRCRPNERNCYQTEHVHCRFYDGCDCKRRRVCGINSEMESRKLWEMENENKMLKQQLLEMSKKNSHLQATNEFLLEQNARLRIGEKAAPLAAVTVPAVTVPAITLANDSLPMGQMLRTMATVPVSLAAVPAGTPVSLATVSMAPVQMAPIVTVSHTPVTSLAHDTITQMQPTQQIISYPILNRTLLQGARYEISAINHS